jgi:RNA-directed DNA polymerase
MEKRGRLEGTPQHTAKGQTQRWQPVQPHLVRVNAVARRDGQARFTALVHHVDVDALSRAFKRQRRAASPGVDGVTVDEYERNLEENLQRLHERVHSGQYWPKPVLRVYIPKADGGKRGLGLPALEDKIVQSAVAEVLNAIYEADFYGFSYGFRPGRSSHGALESLEKALMTQRVNWVLDFDIRTFFDSLDHEWLVRMLEHRIADRRIIRLIRRWLKAGILEGGEWSAVETGSPQGSGISPLLANVFLHYSFDAWIHQWRQRQARGRIVVVRYADDGVVGAEYESDAQKLLEALRERLAKFGLALNEAKTRLIEFGRRAVQRRAKAGLRRPETFNFLGFTHYCGATRSGKFMVKRKTQTTRMVRKLKELRADMRKRWHERVPEQYTWLSQVLRGHYGYYGLIFNHKAMNQFYQLVRRMWFKALKRRSQKSKMTWAKFARLQIIFPLPKPTTHQSWYRAS